MRGVVPLLAIASVGALSLAGCGESATPAEQREASDRERIEALTERFAVAVASKDAAAFCATLAPNDVERLGEGRGDGSKRCLVVWGKGRNPLFAAREPELELEEIAKLTGSAATVELANGGELSLTKEGGGWHIHLAPEAGRAP